MIRRYRCTACRWARWPGLWQRSRTVQRPQHFSSADEVAVGLVMVAVVKAGEAGEAGEDCSTGAKGGQGLCNCGVQGTHHAFPAKPALLTWVGPSHVV